MTPVVAAVEPSVETCADLHEAGVALFYVLEEALQRSGADLEIHWKELVMLLHALDQQGVGSTNMMDRLVRGLQFQDRHKQLLEDSARAMALYRWMLEQPEHAIVPVQQLLAVMQLSELRHAFLARLRGEEPQWFAGADPTVDLF